MLFNMQNLNTRKSYTNKKKIMVSGEKFYFIIYKKKQFYFTEKIKFYILSNLIC